MTGGPFPERLHITILFADLVARLLEAVDGWASDAAAEVATWPRTSNLGLSAGADVRLHALIERTHTVLDRTD
jgi:hypothetical protein